MGPAELVDVGVGLGNGGGVTCGVVLGSGGGTRTPGPFGMIGRGTGAPGLIDGTGEGEDELCSSSSSFGDGDADGTCATVRGEGKHGVFRSARARA